MISRIIDFQDVLHADRWRVELFTDIITTVIESQWPMVLLSEVAEESSDAIIPADYPENNIFYVGLENVESVTGEPVNLERRDKISVKSRSKTFKSGDILYGRLRPYLRKAFLAHSPYTKGICSTEFIVLKPNAKKILPDVLRALLVSKHFTDDLSRFQIGAALPRISSKDFFSLRIPLPPLPDQKEWADKIVDLLRTIKEARQHILEFPDKLDTCLNMMIKK